MANIVRITLLSILSIIILFSMLNCAPSISQEEYDSVKSELSDVTRQVATLQDRSGEAMIIEAQYHDLITQYEKLEKQHDARIDEIDEIKTIKSNFDELNTKYEQLKEQDDARFDEIQATRAEYDELNKEFEELKIQYNIITQGKAVFSEDAVEEAVFELLNKERGNNGIPELEWGINLYKWAKQNSREMAEIGEYQYSDAGAAWQEIFMGVGYGTVGQLANAALINWKANDYRYRYNILNHLSTYGSVGTYILNEVYYVTYMASVYK